MIKEATALIGMKKFGGIYATSSPVNQESSYERDDWDPIGSVVNYNTRREHITDRDMDLRNLGSTTSKNISVRNGRVYMDQGQDHSGDVTARKQRTTAAALGMGGLVGGALGLNHSVGMGAGIAGASLLGAGIAHHMAVKSQHKADADRKYVNEDITDSLKHLGYKNFSNRA